MSSEIKKESPHIRNIFETVSYQTACSMAFMLYVSITNNTGIMQMDKDVQFQRYQTRRLNSLIFFDETRFGTNSQDGNPFETFGQTIKNFNEKFKCTEEKSLQIPETVFDAYQCFTSEMLFPFLYSLFDEAFSVQKYENIDKPVEIQEKNVEDFWYIQYYIIYDQLFYPILQTCFSDVHNLISDSVSLIRNASFILLAISFCFSFTNLILTFQKIKEYRFALKLFLHFQPSIILQVPSIVRLLSGNFKSATFTTINRDREFFQIAIEQLPIQIIIVDADGNIVSMNKSARELFLEFKTDNDLFKWEKINRTAEQILNSNVHSVKAIIERKVFLLITSQIFEKNRVYTMTNITQQQRYERLIKEEFKKSDNLLKSILPPSLVERVKKNEANISFSVQSCSVVFLDVVEFTPWCGANSAKTIMSTLNLFFEYLDEIISRLPTMTRIKCFGDCYMAAGGIFAEPNQPVVHAKEAIEFSLGALESLKKVNKEKETQLQIRIGVHTGGPIIAGVIGLGKPTFEILGSTIVTAQQMEHTGVPMKVQITRSVYELIYGTNFHVVERGLTEIKGGNIMTYLISHL
jgi:class 3 adenylate cyclase/PAS domain-containing protein